MRHWIWTRLPIIARALVSGMYSALTTPQTIITWVFFMLYCNPNRIWCSMPLKKVRHH